MVCPGNAGMAALGTRCVPGPPETVAADLYVIGPEAPLVDGLADRLRAAGHLVFGPGADGARLEGSKAWMKDVLSAAGVPTAAYGVFTEAGPALEFLRSLSPPYVVKTDGLAAGKGVLVTPDLVDAAADVQAKLSGRAFGDAGRRVVIEEGLTGPEVSLMAVCDGKRAVALAPAQDFKRIGDGDTGPNTGGMGAFSPVPRVADGLVADIMKTAITPTLEALRARGIEYRGTLYAGLMLTANGFRGAGIQRSLRRSGDAGRHASLGRRCRGSAGRGGGRPIRRRGPAPFLGRRVRMRGAGGAGLPRRRPYRSDLSTG